LVAYNSTSEAKLEVLGKRAKYNANNEPKDDGGLHCCDGFKTKLLKHIIGTFLVASKTFSDIEFWCAQIMSARYCSAKI
jgi:hypothetical protein